MKHSILRGTVAPSSPSLHSVRTPPSRPVGLFDNSRRTGVVIASATVLTAIGSITIATMGAPSAGPMRTPTQTAAPIGAPAPAMAAETQPPAHVSAVDPRGPRVVRIASPAETPAISPPAAAETTERPATTPKEEAAAAGAKPSGTRPPPIPIASTENQVVAMEARMKQSSSNFVQPADKAPVATTASATKAPAVHSTAGLQPAATTTWVNLRAGPDNKAKVITAVPARAAIKAPARCKFWCEVEFKGRHGYIYKDFVTRPENGKNTADLR